MTPALVARVVSVEGVSHIAIAPGRTFCGATTTETGRRWTVADIPTCDACGKGVAAIKAEIHASFWRDGDLSYKLDATQRKIRALREAAWKPKTPTHDRPQTVDERVRAAKVPISFFELCARGNGKTYELLLAEIETALRVKDARILHCAPLRDDAEKIAKDIIELFILPDCPKDLRPEWRAGEGEYFFPSTGANIRFRGTNNDSVERLRGFGYHLVVMDECGSMDRLRYVLGIVRPLAERLKGKVILATTPAETPSHESTELYREHLEDGAAVKFTLLDNPRKTWEEKASILLNEREAAEHVADILAGKMRPKKTSTLREFWCEFVVEASSAVIPEFLDSRDRVVVPRVERPAYFDGYCAIDPGVKDRTGILWGFYDFERGVIVIEAEALIARAGFVEVADSIEATDRRLWGDAKFAGGREQPARRVSDVDAFFIEGLRERRINVSKTRKDDSMAAVNFMRSLFSGNGIEIHESCVNLIHQIETATWNTTGKDFARDESGHSDLVAALKYLCRNVDRQKNPFPKGYRPRDDLGENVRVRVRGESSEVPISPYRSKSVEASRKNRWRGFGFR